MGEKTSPLIRREATPHSPLLLVSISHLGKPHLTVRGTFEPIIIISAHELVVPLSRYQGQGGARPDRY